MNSKHLRHLAATALLAGAVAAPLAIATPAAAAPTREAIVAIAQRELNDATRNYEVGTNCSFYGGEMFNWPACGGKPGWGGGTASHAWCAAFAKYVWREGGVTSYLSQIGGYAESFQAYAINHGTWHSRSSGYTPQPGDAIVFDWDRVAGDEHPIDHVAIVTGYSAGQVHTIGGNESDRVKTSSYSTSNIDIVGYASPVGLVAAPPPAPMEAGGKLGDFNGDGKPDVAVFDSTGNGLYISRNTSTAGSPSKAASQLVSTGWSSVKNIAVVDWDGDGKDDIVGQSGDALLVWRSTSSATSFSFTAYSTLGTGMATVSEVLPMGDFNGDGKPDLAVYGSSGDQLYVSLNTSTPGNPSKAAGQLVSAGWSTVTNLSAVDWDGDGKADLVGQSGDGYLLWRSTSSGSSISFAPYITLGTGMATATRVLQPTDFDGDGKPDLGVFGASGDNFYISRNTSTPGNPSKSAGQLVSGGWGTVKHLMTADFDGDGKEDILASSGDSLLTWRSTSTSTANSFTAYISLGTGMATVGRTLTTKPAGTVA
jgi:hypothetical protein